MLERKTDMNTRFNSFLVMALIALIVSGCKPRVVVGPEQTFTVDVPNPESSHAMNVTLEVAAPQGTLALGGGAKGLVQGAIIYNAVEYKPQMTNGDGTLHITQTLPGPKSVVVTTQNNLINQWELRLGDAPMNLEIRLEDGDYNIEFDKSLPAHFNATVNAGVGMVYLRVEPGLTAQVTIGEKTSLLKVNTRGTWTQNGDEYETDDGSAVVTITVNMPGAELTLDNK
jgi:hypothetical protein